MSLATCELRPLDARKDGHTFVVTVETSTEGVGRLSLACLKRDNDENINTQGVDLTPAECRSLAKMLCATAELVESESLAA